MILIFSSEGDDNGLLAELARLDPVIHGRMDRPGCIAVDRPPGQDPLPPLAWAQQVLPGAERIAAPSINAWARAILERIQTLLPEGQPWRLHILPHYGMRRQERMGARAWHSSLRRGGPRRDEPAEDSPASIMAGAGENRCRWIESALKDLLKERRRHLLKSMSVSSAPFLEVDSLVQVVLTSPESGWISLLKAPGPYRWRQTLSPFPGGKIPVAVDKSAPSRAFAKLIEAQHRLGRVVLPGERCVDLGASPGGWSYVVLQQGGRVWSVDRSPLRDDLMRHSSLTFIRGDAFTYRPESLVDWLVCDVIAAPEKAIEMLLNWLRLGLMRWFVVTIKLKGEADHPKLERLKRELPDLTQDWSMVHLCANKGEVCALGRSKTP